MLKNLSRRLWYFQYNATLVFLKPLNTLLALCLKNRVWPNSVLHISYMVHVPFHATRILRTIGLRADYLAKGSDSNVWDKSDFRSPSSLIPSAQAILEFILLWRIVARYSALHLHFGLTMTRSGWELPILKSMNRKIIIHWRGCEIRDYKKNVELNPSFNICQKCDYNHYCISDSNLKRIRKVSAYGHKFLVTTPDLLDFSPHAEYIPFFCPESSEVNVETDSTRFPNRPLRILHWTNHPGIEGTSDIQDSISQLREKGYSVDLTVLRGMSHESILRKIPDYDLTIGKMKMGYYANSQIESMVLGVPAITWVRPEFMTDQLSHSGFIISRLQDLTGTLEKILQDPRLLEEKRAVARSSIMQIHDNNFIAERYRSIYFSN